MCQGPTVDSPSRGRRGLRGQLWPVGARLLIVAAWLWLPGCEREQPSAARSTDKPLVAYFVSCPELRANGSCQLPTGTTSVQVWVQASPRAKVRVALVRPDGAKRFLKVSPSRALDGLLLDLPLDSPPAEIRLEVDGDAQTSLRVQPQPVNEGLDRARQLRGSGELDAATTAAEDVFATGDAELRARASGLLARIALSRDDIDGAVAGLKRSIELAEAAGLRTSAANDRFALSHTLRRRKHALSEAEAVLEAVDDADLSLPMWANYYRGLVAWSRGDSRAALRLLRGVHRVSAELAIWSVHATAAYIIAETLAALGRAADGLEVINKSAARVPEDACSQAALALNVGWVELLAAQQGDRKLSTAATEKAVSLLRGDCPNAWMRDTAILNLALAAAFAGDDARAMALLKDSEQSTSPGVSLRTWRADLGARLALQRGNSKQAVETVDQVLQRLGGALDGATRYRLLLTKGRALREQNRKDSALAAFRQAERALMEQEREVPLGTVRASFLSTRHAAASETVDLLLDLNRPTEAMLRARREQSRLFRNMKRWARLSELPTGAARAWEDGVAAFRQAREALDREAENAWAVPVNARAAFEARVARLAEQADQALDGAMRAIGDESKPPPLAPLPPPREAWLTAHPTRRGWVAMLAFDGRVRVARFDRLDPADTEELSRRLLQPFGPQLKQAEVLKVMGGGAFERVNVHALPFEGEPLLASLPVVYSLDLGRTPVAHTGEPGASGLVVADPRRDLRLARKEQQVATRVLSRSGPVKTLVGDQATRDAVRRALGDAQWLHYAGHAERSRGGMMRSALSLANKSALELSDLLALKRAPRHVVLNACEGAATWQGTSKDSSLATVGLAQAFVLAGSQAVVASTEQIADTLAYALAEALYASGPRVALTPEGFRQAILALRGEFPDTWQAVRLLTG